MASWQYDIELLPRSKLLELYSEVPQSIEMHIFENTDWWKGHQLSQQVEGILNQCLPKFKSWLANSVEWGTEDGHRVSIGLNEDEIEWIWIRIDVRSSYKEMVDCLITLARQLDCLMLLMEDMEIIEADEIHLLMNIEISRATRFVNDPERYFEDLINARKARVN